MRAWSLQVWSLIVCLGRYRGCETTHGHSGRPTETLRAEFSIQSARWLYGFTLLGHHGVEVVRCTIMELSATERQQREGEKTLTATNKRMSPVSFVTAGIVFMNGRLQTWIRCLLLFSHNEVPTTRLFLSLPGRPTCFTQPQHT